MPCGRDIQTCPRTYQIGIKEAIVAAKFQKDYWNLKDGRPGLVRVKAKLPEATAEEIPSLVRAVQAAHTDYLLIVDPKVLDLGERAREVHDELESRQTSSSKRSSGSMPTLVRACRPSPSR